MRKPPGLEIHYLNQLWQLHSEINEKTSAIVSPTLNPSNEKLCNRELRIKPQE